MKRIIVLLLISLLLKTTSISQNILRVNDGDSVFVLTPTQLKQTNLIFSEHSKLLNENTILKNTIIKYDTLVNNYCKLDSVNKEKIILYKEDIETKNSKISSLENSIKVYRKVTLGAFILYGILSILYFIK